MGTKLNEIHGTLKRMRHLIVDGASREQTLHTLDEAIEAAAEFVEIKELLDQHESNSGRSD
jgi:hypothetical protein